MTSLQLTPVLFYESMAIYGFLLIIVPENGRQIVSELYTSLCSDSILKKSTTAKFHMQATELNETHNMIFISRRFPYIADNKHK